VKVDVLFFAVLRERAGCERQDLELPAGATAGMASVELARLYPTLSDLIARIPIAVNRQMVKRDHVLREGDELALIPPVAGGAGSSDGSDRRVAVLPSPLSAAEVAASVAGDDCGAVVTFTGQVRRHGQLAEVDRIEYEAYQPMAEAVLCEIASEIEREWAGSRVAIHHRTGSLGVGDLAVVVAVAAPHRAAAFDACRAGIERLKERAPIWKKEIGPDGAVWIGLRP
jgi:molybdopterin synthase catalytic subunit